MATPMQFTFTIPTNIVFGLGALDTISTHAAALGFKRPLIVTDKIMSQSEGVKRALAKLKEAGLQGVVWDNIAAEPTDQTITEGVKYYRAERCDGLIGFGGGSSMDTAKGIGVLAVTGDDDPTPYQRFGAKTVPGSVPNIAIPTTAGTGSEVTSPCVLTSLKSGHKLPIRHPSMLPKVALVDPRLMMSMPPKVTMATGIDALSHALECFTQVREHPFSDTLALQATKLIVENLPAAVKNGQDETARSNMALAATMAGTAFEIGGLQFHAYAQALGAKYHAPHGVTCGIALRAGLGQILPIATAKLARMAWAFGIDTRGLSQAAAAERAVSAAVAFISDMGIPKITEAMKATRDDIPMLLKETLETTAAPIPPETAQAVWQAIFR
ncbi:MAG TPA: iron-containing alcohol dehydrogenase [Candidatus Sulfotelmatobacter sp.]|nr:iron-containing alcohol dehydrogenase [Candidatus Sulfotelmatobacter sp.]